MADLITSELVEDARYVLEQADRYGLTIATAESCTGGFLATLLTDLAGLSHSFECGFVVYSEDAKSRLLGIPRSVIERQGAVSREVAVRMAAAGLERCDADIVVAVTGYAGPSDDDGEEGLVHFAVARRKAITRHHVERFGKIGRDEVRRKSLTTALGLLSAALG